MRQPSRPDPDGLGPIVRRRDALTAGLTSNEIRQRVRGGRWQAIHTGVYLTEAPTGRDSQDTERINHILRAVAACMRREHSAIAFESAAAFHRLPLVSGLPDVVTLAVPPGAWSGSRARVRVRVAHLSDMDVDRSGPPITTPARTWVDLARTLPFADALSAGDAGLRSSLLNGGAIADALARAQRERGCQKAVHASLSIDARRETPLESLSYARFIEWDIPLPEMQVEFRDDRGYVGRVDFYWRQAGVIGEADGRLKYQTPDDLYTEKRREDRLRALGLTVVRWSWSDMVSNSTSVQRRLSRLLAD